MFSILCRETVIRTTAIRLCVIASGRNSALDQRIEEPDWHGSVSGGCGKYDVTCLSHTADEPGPAQQWVGGVGRSLPVCVGGDNQGGEWDDAEAAWPQWYGVLQTAPGVV